MLGALLLGDGGIVLHAPKERDHHGIIDIHLHRRLAIRVVDYIWGSAGVRVFDFVPA